MSIKQEYGNKLYPIILDLLKQNSISESYAAKVTGMLLELDAIELEEFLQTRSQLIRMVNEALEVLQVEGVVQNTEDNATNEKVVNNHFQ